MEELQRIGKRSDLENGGIVLGGGNFPIPVALRVGTEGPDKKRVLEGGNEKKKKIATTGGRQGKEKKEKKCDGDECGEQ